MTTKTRRPTPFLLCVLWLALPALGAAQPPTEAQIDLQAVALELLAYQCGSSEEENQFELAVRQLDPPPVELFLAVLQEGPPREVRARAEKDAVAAYDERQRWLEENGRELFGEQTEEIAKRSREEYVAESLRRLEILYRGNAARALGAVAGETAVPALRKAAQRDPDLKTLAHQALERIERRSGSDG